MIQDQWLTFLIAAVGIFIFLSIGFQSVIIGGITLIPNTLPIVFILGILGWVGEPINMGTGNDCCGIPRTFCGQLSSTTRLLFVATSINKVSLPKHFRLLIRQLDEQ